MEGAVRADVRPTHGSVGLPKDARRTGGAWVAPCACVRQHFADADVTVMAIRFRWVLLMCLKAVRFERSAASLPAPFQGLGPSNKSKSPGSTRLTRWPFGNNMSSQQNPTKPLRARGFTGGYTTVSDYLRAWQATPGRRATSPHRAAGPPPPAATIYSAPDTVAVAAPHR